MTHDTLIFKEILFEVNHDLNIPLSFKVALKEFEIEASKALKEHAASMYPRQTLMEFANLPYDQLKAAFEALPSVDVNRVNLVADVIEPNPEKSRIPQGLLSALRKMLTGLLEKGIEKLPLIGPMTEKRWSWITKLEQKDPAAAYRFKKYAAMGGKITSLATMAISALYMLGALGTGWGILIPVGAGLLRLITDMARGEKASTAIANMLRNIAIGAAVGTAVGYADGKWPEVREFITSNAARFGLTGAQTQAVASANNLSQIPSTGADGPAAGSMQTAPSGGLPGGDGPAAGSMQTAPSGGLPGGDGPAAGSMQTAPSGGLPGGDALAAANAAPFAGANAVANAGVGDVVANANAAPLAGATTVGSTAITVQPGDTLSQIAQANRVSVADMMQANPQITNPGQIVAGQRLVIPTETGSPVFDRGVGLRRTRQ